MKKKRNFLTIISSILGCIAICGFSLFSLFIGPKEKVQSASASMSLNDLTNCNVSFVVNDNDNVVPLVSSYVDNNLPAPSGFYDLCAIYSVNGYANGEFFEKISVSKNVLVLPQWVMTQYQFNVGVASNYVPNNNPRSLGVYNVTVSNSNNYYSSNFTLTSISFVNGDDIQNSSLLDLLNLCCDFTGFNNYTLDNVTAEQYQEMINNLNDEVNYLNEQVNGLQYQINTSYTNGYEQGKQDAELVAQNQISQAYISGKADGYNEADNQDAVVVSIFSGILQVALVPINFFLGIFNFEILGINLSAFIRAIFTVVLTIIVLKTVLGKGGGSSDN